MGMNMFEEARSVQGMMRMRNLTQSEMARQLGVSQSFVANKLRLLKLGRDEEEKICSAELTERHARALLKLRDADLRRQALERVCERKMNVAETEALVDMLHDGCAPRVIGGAERLERVNVFRETLRRSLETLSSLGVNVKQSTNYYGNKMYITISIEE
jgi:ParB family chromosome partitioning protein